MSEAPGSKGMNISMDAAGVYREDVYTDRRVGTLRVMTPVTAQGTPDTSRTTLYVGQISVSTPMGTLPISFEVDGAKTLSEAIAGFGAAAQKAMDDTMRGFFLMLLRVSTRC